MKTHEDEKLNDLLGETVKVVLFDGSTAIGVLKKAEYKLGLYQVADYCFRKTHIKRVEKL